MALIKCAECGKEVSDKAAACPHCGYPIQSQLTETAVQPVEQNTTPEYDRYLQLARRAKQDGNSENAAKYYELALLAKPSDWESNYYTVYFKAMSCVIAQIQSAATSVSNCIPNVMQLIGTELQTKDERLAAIREIAASSKVISTMLDQAATNHWAGIDPEIRDQYTTEMLERCISAGGIPCYVADAVDEQFSHYPETHAICVDLWKYSSQLLDGNRALVPAYAQRGLNDLLNILRNNIRKYDQAEADSVRVQQLNQRIRYLEAQTETLNKGKRTLGIVFIVSAVVCFFLYMIFDQQSADLYRYSPELKTMVSLMLWAAIGFMIAGICKCVMKPKGVEAAESELQSARNELSRLKQK